MTIITTPTGKLILDSAGRPANGFLAGSQTARFNTVAGVVTRAQFRGVIREGQLFGPNGSGVLDIPATPTDQAVQLWEILAQKDLNGRKEYVTTVRMVDVPSGASAAYVDLLDVELPPAGGWVIPPYIQTIIDGLAALDAAVDAAEAAQAAAEAVGSTSDAQVAGFVSTAGASDTQTALDKRYSKALDVKKFGAIGDGIANDTAAIQALINVAGETPIVFSPGTYKITNQLVIAVDDQTLIGTGGTIAPSATVHGIYASGKKRLRVDGLKFTGGLTQVYLDAGSDDALIVNCVSTAPKSAFVRAQLSHRAKVVRNTATAIPFGGHGVVFWGGNAATYPGVYGVDGGLVEGNHFTSFVPTSSADGASSPCWSSCAQNLRVVGNYFASFSDVGIDFEGSRDCVAVGNTVKDCANGGLATFYGTTGCLFEGNRVIGTAALTDTTRARCGIRVGTSGASSNNSFVGNHVSMTVGFGQYGAYIDGSTFAVGATHKWLVLRGNTFTDCQIFLWGAEDCFVQGNTVNNGQIRSQSSDRIQFTGNTVYAGALSAPGAFRVHSSSATKIGKNCVIKDNTIRDYAASGFGKIVLDQTGSTAAVGHVVMNNLTAATTTQSPADVTTNQTGNVIVA